MILLMPTEITLKRGQTVWGMLRVEVNEAGDLVSLDLRPTEAKVWSPFCKLALVDVPNLGTQLAWRLYGAGAQEGELDASGNIRLKPKAS